MKKIVVALIMMLMNLAITTGLQAQTINGTVSSVNDDSPVPYANIALLRATDSSFIRGTSTTVDGTFCIKTDTMQCLLRVSAIGYVTQWLHAPTNDTPLKVSLANGATTLDEVSVTASKPMYAADGEKKLYNVSEDPTIQNGTAQDALQNAPGVLVDGDGNITLNGKAVSVYINDRESHYTGEMLKQYIKTLTAAQINTIEVMEYPPAKYGGGGPVINIRTD